MVVERGSSPSSVSFSMSMDASSWKESYSCVSVRKDSVSRISANVAGFLDIAETGLVRRRCGGGRGGREWVSDVGSWSRGRLRLLLLLSLGWGVVLSCEDGSSVWVDSCGSSRKSNPTSSSESRSSTARKNAAFLGFSAISPIFSSARRALRMRANSRCFSRRRARSSSSESSRSNSSSALRRRRSAPVVMSLSSLATCFSSLVRWCRLESYLSVSEWGYMVGFGGSLRIQGGQLFLVDGFAAVVVDHLSVVGVLGFIVVLVAGAS